jgi:glycosyltransferase involved in cell wall biosynthesis
MIERAQVQGSHNRASAPIRVLHLLPRLSRGGGVQIVVRRLAEGIDAQRIDLHVATVRPRAVADELDDLPLTVHPLNFEGDHYRAIDRLALSNRVERLVQTIRPDVVQVHSGMAWLGLTTSIRWPRLPFVFEIHDSPGSGRHGRLTDVAEGRWSRLRRPRLVCHSASVESALVDQWKIPPARITRFPLAVDTNTFTPDPSAGEAAREGLSIPADAFAVIAVGRLVPSKRFEMAIAAAARLGDGTRPIHLLLVGDGPERERLTALAAGQNHATVHMCGPVFGTDLSALLNSANCLVSTSEYEGFGLTLIEAMAVGTPVVAMLAGGVGDIVRDGENGFLVDLGDEEALVLRLRSLRDEPDLAANLGFNALSHARRLYSIPRMAAEFTEVYSSVLDSARARGG